MQSNPNLDSTTTNLLFTNINAAQKFNENSKFDNIGFVIIPFPFSSLNNENKVFAHFTDALNKKRPNLIIEKLFDGSYLRDFLLEIGYNSFHYISIAKLPINAVKNINILPFLAYPFGNSKEISQADLELLAKYGITPMF